MKHAVRRVLTGATFFAAFYFTFWAPFPISSASWPSWIAIPVSLAVAFLVARFVWRRTATPTGGPLAMAGLGAALTGTMGFIGGFVGPMIVAPDANLGPSIGIMLTGPIGAAVGAVGGFVYGMVRQQRVEG